MGSGWMGGSQLVAIGEPTAAGRDRQGADRPLCVPGQPGRRLCLRPGNSGERQFGDVLSATHRSGGASLQIRQSERIRRGTVAGMWRTMVACAISLTVCLLCPGLGVRAQSPPAVVTFRSLTGTEAGTVLGRGVIDSEGVDVGPLVDVLVD